FPFKKFPEKVPQFVFVAIDETDQWKRTLLQLAEKIFGSLGMKKFVGSFWVHHIQKRCSAEEALLIRRYRTIKLRRQGVKGVTALRIPLLQVGEPFAQGRAEVK